MIKSCIWVTPTLSACADSSTNAVKYCFFLKLFFTIWHFLAFFLFFFFCTFLWFVWHILELGQNPKKTNQGQKSWLNSWNTKPDTLTITACMTQIYSDRQTDMATLWPPESVNILVSPLFVHYFIISSICLV